MIFNTQGTGFWNKHNIPQFNHEEVDVQVLLGNFYKVGRTFKGKCLRTYFLAKQLLFYSDLGKGQKIKGVVTLDTVYANFSKQPRLEIRLQNQGHCLTLFTDSEMLFETWKEAFSQSCILSSFDQDYTLGEVIGSGSFSTVYMCQDRQQKMYSAKVINKSNMSKLCKNKEFQDQLANEISSLRQVSHEHILRLYRVYESPGKIYLITELIVGSELISQQVAKMTYSAEDLTIFMFNTLSALAMLHEMTILHRDIKPQNIMLRNCRLCDPCIIDFGLSAFEGQRDMPYPQCGSPGYSAPEIFKFDQSKRKYTTQCDIFSLGISIFVIVYGYNPFKSQDQKTTIQKNQDALVEIPNYPKMPKTFENLLSQMIKKYPKDRIKARDALNHPFFSTHFNLKLQLPKQALSKQQLDILYRSSAQKIQVGASCDLTLENMQPRHSVGKSTDEFKLRTESFQFNMFRKSRERGISKNEIRLNQSIDKQFDNGSVTNIRRRSSFEPINDEPSLDEARLDQLHQQIIGKQHGKTMGYISYGNINY